MLSIRLFLFFPLQHIDFLRRCFTALDVDPFNISFFFLHLLFSILVLLTSMPDSPSLPLGPGLPTCPGAPFMMHNSKCGVREHKSVWIKTRKAVKEKSKLPHQYSSPRQCFVQIVFLWRVLFSTFLQ